MVRFITDPYPSNTGKMMLDCRQYVVDCAKEWEKAANVRFIFAWGEMWHDDVLTSHIRITFESGITFCYVGSEANKIGQETATMNFGWVPEYFEVWDVKLRQMVLHLFGHALGMINYRKGNNQPPVPGNADWLENHYLRRYSWVPKEFKSWVCDAYNSEMRQDLGLVDENTTMIHAIPKEARTDGLSSSWPSSLSILDALVTCGWYRGHRWIENYGTHSLDDIKIQRPLSKKNSRDIKFPIKFPEKNPEIMIGINRIDQDCDHDLTLNAWTTALNDDPHKNMEGFTAHLD